MLITNWTFNDIMTITRFVSTISEIKELFANTGNDLETSVDPFITFLDLLCIKYQQTQVNKKKKIFQKYHYFRYNYIFSYFLLLFI
jgi:hypothetical protein